jgi:NAD(P)-dependent dehydrogenase (short-subunit alcohol dehydrogenase family)
MFAGRMKKRLTSKVAIITGSAQGIGAAFAVGLAMEGAQVVVADILDGNKVVRSIEKAGCEAIFVKTDVTSQDECDAMAKAANDRFGSIDVLINNAAVFGSLVKKPFTEITTEEWNHVMEVNVGGAFHCTKAVFPYMRERGGKIINMCSSTIFEGVPGLGVPHYVASKGAVMAFTRAMARTLGEYKINVNSIAPGFTHSEGGDRYDKKNNPVPAEERLMPRKCIKREGVPEDLVGTAIFLSSDDSNSITGQLIVNDLGVNFH